jgi:transcriptional regulator with XRE-family HTH domain
LFFNNFLKLCELNKLPQSKVLNDLDLSTGNLYKWKNGASINSDLLIKLADYFNVSVDYLLTGRESLNSLSEREIELLNLFRKIESEKLQDRFIGKAELIIEEMAGQDMKKDAIG